MRVIDYANGGNGYSLSSTGNESVFDSGNYYIADQDQWDSTFDTTFDSTTETIDNNSYWADAWDAANTPLGTGIIGGLADGYTNYQSQQSADDKYNNNFDYQVAYDARQFAIEEDKLRVQREQLALQQQAQDDIEDTRKRHNTSINKKSGGSKKVSFG